MAVHAALLIAALPGGKRGNEAATLPDLRASLVAVTPAAPEEPTSPAPAPPVLAAPPAQSPVVVPAPERPPAPAQAPPPRAARAGVGIVEVVAEPLADRGRLGEYLARQVSEFRAEIDRPVRLEGKIVARYPASALAQGREDSVVVWVIVDAQGNAEEVHVAEGSEEFASEVVAAVRASRFVPAENRLKPIRHPIALEFDFRARRGTVARTR